MAATGIPAPVVAIYRYPVKGLTPERLQSVELAAGETIPFDRAWAIENGPGRFDPSSPRHLPKINFLMLMRNERLAALDCSFDGATTTLTISRNGAPVVTGDLSAKSGRLVLEQFFAAFMKNDLRGPPRIVHAPGHCFSDAEQKCVHIINLASLRELERAAGIAIDPLRFRPNIVIDGAAPWEELGWVGREVRAGEAALEIFQRTDRCAATNVDPATGARNLDIPAKLARRWGHTDFGVYARVSRSGRLAAGSDTLTLFPKVPD